LRASVKRTINIHQTTATHKQTNIPFNDFRRKPQPLGIIDVSLHETEQLQNKRFATQKLWWRSPKLSSPKWEFTKEAFQLRPAKLSAGNYDWTFNLLLISIDFLLEVRKGKPKTFPPSQLNLRPTAQFGPFPSKVCAQNFPSFCVQIDKNVAHKKIEIFLPKDSRQQDGWQQIRTICYLCLLLVLIVVVAAAAAGVGGGGRTEWNGREIKNKRKENQWEILHSPRERNALT